MTESVKHVLLVISTAGFAEESTTYALDQAKARSASLDILLVGELERRTMADRLSEESWIGDKIGSELSAALVADKRARAERTVEGVVLQAKAAGISVERHFVDGALEQELRRYTREHRVDEVILSMPEPGLLARILPFRKTNDQERLTRALGVPVRIFYYQ